MRYARCFSADDFVRSGKVQHWGCLCDPQIAIHVLMDWYYTTSTAFKNTTSDKKCWYWINFGAFFDQNDVIARAKSPTLRIFRGNPGGHSNCRFLHRSWFDLLFPVIYRRSASTKVNSSALCYGWGALCQGRVSAFSRCWKKRSLAFSFIWSFHFLEWTRRTKVIIESKFVFSRNSYSAMRNLDAPCKTWFLVFN